MIQEFLQSNLPLDSSVSLKRSDTEPDKDIANARSEAFEIVSDSGETVGFVKAWEAVSYTHLTLPTKRIV